MGWLPWFSMIFHDFPWFTRIFHDVPWFTHDYVPGFFHDVPWFSMIYHDFQWFSYVFSHVSPWYQHSIPVESTNFHPTQKNPPGPPHQLRKASCNCRWSPIICCRPSAATRLAAEDVDFGRCEDFPSVFQFRDVWWFCLFWQVFNSSFKSPIPKSWNLWGNSYVKLLEASTVAHCYQLLVKL